MEWTETEARLPAAMDLKSDAVGGGKPEDYLGKYVRYRNIRVKPLGPVASAK